MTGYSKKKNFGINFYNIKLMLQGTTNINLINNSSSSLKKTAVK